MSVPGLSTGAGSSFQGSSGASIGDTATGAQRFGGVNFGSMAQGIDARWLIGAVVIALLAFIAFLIWG